MKISRGNFLMIKLILAVFEIIQHASGSNLSDSEDRLLIRTREGSDLGVSSDCDVGNSNKTEKSSIQSIYNPAQKGQKPPTFQASKEELSPFTKSPYFREFTRANYVGQGDNNGIASDQMDNYRLRRFNSEGFDSETLKRLRGDSLKDSENVSDSKWIEMFSQEHLESISLPDEGFNFNSNVSNAAFFSYFPQSSVDIAGPSVCSSVPGTGNVCHNSPVNSRKENDPFELKIGSNELKVGAGTKDVEGKPEAVESQAKESQSVDDSKSAEKLPISYKQALISGATDGSIEATKGASLNDLRKIFKKEEGLFENSIKKRGSSGQKQRSISRKSGNVTPAAEKEVSSDSKSEAVKAKTDDTSAIVDTNNSSGASVRSNRQPQTTQDDIYEALMKAARSGSESSSGTKASQSVKVKQLLQQPQQQPLQPPQPQQPNNDNFIPLSQWKNEFRMPQAFAPPACIPNSFAFPRTITGSEAFMEQLSTFRDSLKVYKNKKLDNWDDFKDYKMDLNVFEGTWSSSKSSGKTIFTDSLRNKVFDAPPLRTWIPVRCDALGLDLKYVEAVDGHAGKGLGKTKVSIVSNINSNAQVRYIRKEYYDLEYFTNEYNFLQFAHHPHIPKPYCVEYKPYPSIVMEYVEGERVHLVLYNYGRYLMDNYSSESENRLRWIKLGEMLAKVLAKVLITIKYMHSIGFIHADLKPENIIFNIQTGKLTIIDFDLTVSAPYLFAGRGTESTIAPELKGLLNGPVHFGIDWWSYGSTAAMLIASGLAGAYGKDYLLNYVPFRYDRNDNAYVMTTIPFYFPPLARSFLYPFFNPDPSCRVFSESRAYNWIKRHKFFNVISDWSAYENLSLGPFSELTPMQLGFMSFSKNPILLKSVPTAIKLLSSITNMFVNAFYSVTSTATTPPELKADDGAKRLDFNEEEENEEDDDEEEDDEEQDS